MPWDEISKASYSEFANINYDKLAKNSASRMKKSEQFKAVEERSKEFKSRKDESIVNLKLEKFRAEQKY